MGHSERFSGTICSGKRIFCGILLAGLTACGTTGSDSFFMVSKGEASGMARLFGAGVDFCKVTQSNLQGVTFTGDIQYDGETCTINVTASDE